MILEGTDSHYKSYLENKNSRWVFGNSVLYDMCDKHPYHNQKDIIVGKIWLIGRSYAAAIERRKNANDTNDDFYYDIVAPKMLEIGEILDYRLSGLKNVETPIIDNIRDILEIHKLLMDTFYELTGLEKRSLASKYLHFHCPNMFFIYDSRARNGINKYVKRPDKSLIKNIDCDPEYGDFVCRMIELQSFLEKNLGLKQTPRHIDSFLLR